MLVEPSACQGRPAEHHVAIGREPAFPDGRHGKARSPRFLNLRPGPASHELRGTTGAGNGAPPRAAHRAPGPPVAVVGIGKHSPCRIFAGLTGPQPAAIVPPPGAVPRKEASHATAGAGP